jgi:hypothetical protein
MSALPTRATLAGTPSKASTQALLLEWYDFNAEKLGSDAGAAPVTVASATTVDLDAVTTVRDVVISGTTAITGFTIGRGKAFRVRASGAFTLTNNSAIVTQTGANIIAAAGDSFVLRATAADTVEVLCFTRALERTSKIQSITASVAANALTVTINPTTLDFRSSTLTSGTVNTRVLASAASMVVSSGSTLGTVSATAARIAVLALDNAGTIEVGVVNLAGGVNLDETGVISTTAEGGAGAADSSGVVYSTTARTGVAYRVVGFLDMTQTTAGTYAAAPSTIQGAGGQALAALASVGYGQTWQDVTGSRVASTQYYNLTGKPIMVAITTNGDGNFDVNGVTYMRLTAGTSARGSGSLIIPPGARYAFSDAALYWSELR